jgi:hypothetical protein
MLISPLGVTYFCLTALTAKPHRLAKSQKVHLRTASGASRLLRFCKPVIPSPERRLSKSYSRIPETPVFHQIFPQFSENPVQPILYGLITYAILFGNRRQGFFLLSCIRLVAKYDADAMRVFIVCNTGKNPSPIVSRLNFATSLL